MGYEEQLSAAKFRAERDLARQELARLRGEATTTSAYDLLPKEERDAIAWVRDHGGLDSVKKLLDWVVGHCSTKQQLDFDFWLSGRVMYELGFEEDMADRDEVERRLLARLMPEGYEWPRYESGELVLFGDEFINAKGNASTLRTIAIKGCRDALGGAVFWKLTHERPESWQRLEDDATMPATAYCKRMWIADDGGYSPEELMARDLVRRAKKLAGVSE